MLKGKIYLLSILFFGSFISKTWANHVQPNLHNYCSWMNAARKTSPAAARNVDTTPPVFNAPLPQNLTISCELPVPPPPTVTATDDMDPTPTITLTQTTAAGNCPQAKVITRTWVATDDAGNAATLTRTVTVVDNTAPVFQLPLPANVTLSCGGGAPPAPTVAAVDNCDPGTVPPVIFINEIHYDNAGTDVGEFIEIAGTAGLDLSQYQLVLYNGNGGAGYNTLTLSGLIDNEGAGFGAVSFAYPSNGIQNGSPDGMALVKLPNTVVQYLSYEGTFVAADGAAAGLLSTDIGVQELGTEPIGQSLKLTGTGQVYQNFTWTPPSAQSPGVLNVGQIINPLQGVIFAVLTETTMMGACNGEMTVTRTWKATDACGNTATHTQILFLNDDAAPDFVPPLPPNLTISCENPVPTPATMTAVDACDNGMGVQEIWINEFHYDNTGTDVGEFIEVAGVAGTDLTGYQIVLYNGNGGASYNVMNLTGVIDNEGNGFGAIHKTYPTDGIQNGSPDGIALVHNGMVVQFLSYEGTMTALGGAANGMLSTDVIVQEPSTTPIGQSLNLTGTGNEYSDFAWSGPSTATPGSLNTGQTFLPIVVGLQITFAENTVNSLVCPAEKTITRTWTVTDDCGNTGTHTQVISVVDDTPPTVNCPATITLPLNNFGSATLSNASISPLSFSDNCSPSGSLILIPNATTYDCDDAGSIQIFTVSVQDQCGNIGTCQVMVVIPDQPLCEPEISISDPCVCKNNPSNLTNGQFGESILITSLSGKTWTITSVSGLYQASSPNPPSAPLPFPANFVIIENPAGSGQYPLSGVHVDAIGYSLTATSNTGDILSISNSCQYPNPTILGLDGGPFCLGTDPITLDGDPGDANILSENFTINGNPATVFDPATLGIGFFTIVYTVNGGDPQAVDMQDPGCIQPVSKVVQIIETPDVLTCNNNVQVSLGADCETLVLPDMILEGTYGCFDDYTVKITTLQNQSVPNPVGAAQIGKTLKVKITHDISGNSCWGTISVEDKLAPILTCTDLTIVCAVQDYSPAGLQALGLAGAFPAVDEPCGAFNLTFDDEFFDIACGGVISGIEVSAYLRRTWTAVDASGNLGSCTQYIYLERKHVADVLFPADVTLDCTAANTDPSNTGAPYLPFFGQNFEIFPSAGLCELNTIFTDERLPICDGSFKILRKWVVYDWCLPTVFGQNPRTFIQVIKVLDETGPQILAQANNQTGNLCGLIVETSVEPGTCLADFDLPDLIVSDNCSRLKSIVARWTIDNVTYSTTGSFADFAGNNHWLPDTLAVVGTASNLPLGLHLVTYILTDDCGNSTTCTFRVNVRDLVPPGVACVEFTQVSVGAAGMVSAAAAVFDKGSFDNCGDVFFKVRRMDDNGCQPNNQFHDEAKFCCEDIGDTVTVILRVYDVEVPAGSISLAASEQFSNECMVRVFVDDKLKPVCKAPANVTVSCEAFDPSLWAYGFATGVDNCCIDTILESRNLAQFDTLCNRGTITRTFRVFDCYQNSSTCTQRVFVNYNQFYNIEFPGDRVVFTCDGTTTFGEPRIDKKDCELIAISYEDEIFNVVPDACFKIERTWTVINWCTYDPNTPCIYIPNPNPNALPNHPQNLASVFVSAPGTPAPWTATQRALIPGGPVVDFSTIWQKEANCYQYKQIIKVIDNEDPLFSTVLDDCDLTANDPNFWNSMDWWDATHSSHDLCEAPVNIAATGIDSCVGKNLTAYALIFLDLDGDGFMETVLNSNNFPTLPAGFINYNNAANPNFSGGISRQFDFRPVPPQVYYRFAMRVQDLANGSRKFSVMWTDRTNPNPNNNNDWTLPQIPLGKHKIKWVVSDMCGNEATSDAQWDLHDCKPPTVVCHHGLSANIMPTGMLTIWGVDFLKYGEDNCTPADQLVYSIRKSGTGTGFPLDANGNPIPGVTFTCNELGDQLVEIWARDARGNVAFCETYIQIQDPFSNCNPNVKATVAGALKTEKVDGLQDASIQLVGSHPSAPNLNMTKQTDDAGNYSFPNVPVSSKFTLTPLKDDNYLNGVTTYDLLLMSRHILGVTPLTSPYKMIAADVNKNGSITTNDIVELRKLVLGIYTDLPSNTSWRFVDKSFVFPNVANPFETPFPETRSTVDWSNSLLDENFVAVKIGDVNGNAVANNLMSADDRTRGTLLFDVNLTPQPPLQGRGGAVSPSPLEKGSGDEVKAGEEFSVKITAAELASAFQFTLNFKGLELLEILPQAGLTLENFAVFAVEKCLTTSFDGSQRAVFELKFKATAAGKLSKMLSVSSRITKIEAVDLAGERLDVALRFSENGSSVVAARCFELYQNQPNPFVDRTAIGFFLPEAGAADLTVFDETGRVVLTRSGDFKRGENLFLIEKSELDGTGVLYYQIKTAGDEATRKMILVK